MCVHWYCLLFASYRAGLGFLFLNSAVLQQCSHCLLIIPLDYLLQTYQSVLSVDHGRLVALKFEGFCSPLMITHNYFLCVCVRALQELNALEQFGVIGINHLALFCGCLVLCLSRKKWWYPWWNRPLVGHISVGLLDG